MIALIVLGVLLAYAITVGFCSTWNLVRYMTNRVSLDLPWYDVVAAYRRALTFNIFYLEPPKTRRPSPPELNAAPSIVAILVFAFSALIFRSLEAEVLMYLACIPAAMVAIDLLYRSSYYYIFEIRRSDLGFSNRGHLLVARSRWFWRTLFAPPIAVKVFVTEHLPGI